MALVKLQADLASLNLQEAARKARLPIGLVMLALTAIAAATNDVLIGAALLVATALALLPGWAMILTANALAAGALPLVHFGVVRPRSSFGRLRLPREEFGHTPAWLRALLLARGSRAHR